MGLNVNRKNTSISLNVPMMDYAYSDNKSCIISISSGNARLLRSTSFKDRPVGYDLQGCSSYLSVDEYALRRTGDIYGVGIGKNRLSLLKTEIIPAPLPSGWANKDIAALLPSYAGAAGYANGEFVVTGYGICMDGPSDSMHYVYKKIEKPDCTIVALVDCTYLSAHARVGLMVRETLDPKSKHAFVGTTPGDKFTLFVHRNETASNTIKMDMKLPSTPYWVELVKTANIITSFVSPDGVTWTPLKNGPISLPMDSTYYLGIAAISSHRYGMVRASFKNVQLT